jgi:hypothetical protein
LKKDYQAEFRHMCDAATLQNLKTKLMPGRGDWRALVFRAALERQVELVFRQSPDRDGTLFTSFVDVERGQRLARS